MSSQNQAKYVAAGAGQIYWGPGDQMRFLITGAETSGAFCMAELSVLPGGGPPPHIHQREDESFFLQQGTLTIHVGDQTFHASPGDFVHLPRGIQHSFRNTSNESAKMLVTLTPGGLENFFKETFDLAVEGSAPPALTETFIARAQAASARYGVELLPPK